MLHSVHMQHTKQYKYKDGVPIRCIAFAIPCAHAIGLSIGPSLKDEHQVPWYISRAAPTDLVKCQHFKRIALIYSRSRQTDGIIFENGGDYYRTYSDEGDGLPRSVRNVPPVSVGTGVIERRLVNGRQQLRLRVLARARMAEHPE